MNITWLGQAGLYIETEKTRLLVDPYLSDSVGKKNPNMRRRYPPDTSFLHLKPDIILLTHNHIDHTDPETLPYYLQEPVECLASGNSWQTLREMEGKHHAILFNRHSEWSSRDMHFIAVYAEHSDSHAIGAVIETEGKRLYITGDTLYNRMIFDDVLPHGKMDLLFLPVNGVGNNMNLTDAARFCERIKPDCAIPMHYGMYDDLDPRDFTYSSRMILEPYKKFEF